MALARAAVREVCFAHWPIDPDDLTALLPADLAPAIRDGTAWTSVLAQRTRAGLRGIPLDHAFDQVALRTYVRATDGGEAETDADADADDVGVYFLRLETDGRFAALGGRLAYGLPYRRADVDHRSDGESVRVRSVPRDGVASFAGTFDPRGDPVVADGTTRVGWLTDRYRYYLPDGRSGETDHDRWTLYEASGAVTETGLFRRVGLPTPDGDPILRYSPGVDFRLRRRP